MSTNASAKLFLFLGLCSFAPASNASILDALYTEFSMEQFDNDKPNGFVEFWKLDCLDKKRCTLSVVAFDCKARGGPKVTKPCLDQYSTSPGLGSRDISDLSITQEPKTVLFTFSQYGGPSEINCNIQMSKKSPIEVAWAICTGKGTWSAGTKYVREWKKIAGPIMLDKKCENKVELP